jgi:hypothetical protein
MKLLAYLFKGQHQYLYFLAMIFVFCSCEQNQYVDGKKDGDWIEYLDSSRESEVIIDSAIFLRKIKYNKGMPEGLVSDSYINSTKPKFEFHLMSGPYLQNEKRPADKFIGVVKEFDEKNDKIVDFKYFDQFGILDSRSYFVMGLEELKKDERFDSLYFFSIQDKGNRLQSMRKFHNRPDLFDKEAASIIAKAYANSSIKKLINEDKNNVFINAILFDAFTQNGKNFEPFFELEKQISNNIKNKKQRDVQSNTTQWNLYRNCKWCGEPFESFGLYCSRKCEHEAKNR